MYKFTKGDSVKHQKTLDAKKDLEAIGWKLDEPKKEAPKKKTTPKKKASK